MKKILLFSFSITMIILLSSCTVHTKPTYNLYSYEEVCIFHQDKVAHKKKKRHKNKSYSYRCNPNKDVTFGEGS